MTRFLIVLLTVEAAVATYAAAYGHLVVAHAVTTHTYVSRRTS